MLERGLLTQMSREVLIPLRIAIKLRLIKSETSAKLTRGRKIFVNPLMSAEVTFQPALAMQPRWAV